jgi:hypothetical protein
MMRGGGCAARGRANEAARSKDNRGMWMRRDKRQQDNQPGQTREVQTHRLAVGRQEVEEEGYFYQAVECVFDQICSFGLYVIRYVMFYVFECNLGLNKRNGFLHVACRNSFLFL